METSIQTPHPTGPVNILVVGNNPIEMGYILDKLNQVNSIRVITEIAFDVRSILERLAHFNPSLILIDDNIGRPELKETVSKLTASKKDERYCYHYS